MVCVTSILIVDDDKVKPCIEDDDDDDDDEDEDEDDDDDDDDDEYEYEYESFFFFIRGQTPFNSIFPNGHHCFGLTNPQRVFVVLRTSTRLKRGDFSPHRPATTWWVAVIDTGIDYTHQDLKDAGHSYGMLWP